MPDYLLDTTPVSNLLHARHLDWLRRLFGDEVATTPTVAAEIRAGQQQGLIPVSDLGWLAVLEPTFEEQVLAAELRRQLDAGEAECLAVADRRGYVFLSDDRVARLVAR
jgi:predicted nucleic acid-binding protein